MKKCRPTARAIHLADPRGSRTPARHLSAFSGELFAAEARFIMCLRGSKRKKLPSLRVDGARYFSSHHSVKNSEGPRADLLE